MITDGYFYPEVNLSAGIGNRRLIAKFDLLTIKKDNSAQIIDWKTSRSIPKRNWLIDRMQTRIYPYLLARSGSQLNNGEAIEPDQIEMIYWFAENQGMNERISYSQDQYLQDQNFLENLIVKINSLADADFPMTDNHRRCAFCVYRSLCDRGIVAGNSGEADEYYFDDSQAEIELNFDQIAEIAF
jgi:CRISPR/Cas system-associated exonuclease Cas4 (RecB family)